jgi:hypothetical protein
MAKSHTTDGVYTNPEVRFERTDINTESIAKFAAILGIVLTITASLALWLAWYVTQLEAKSKATLLPPAAVDRDRGVNQSPEPRLEAIEDLDTQKKNFAIYPARASEYYLNQEKQLRDGDEKKGIVPIDSAIDQMKLKSRKEPPPPGFGVALPSKAAAGRVSTGAQ